jgi:hypothetical protein
VNREGREADCLDFFQAYDTTLSILAAWTE